MKFQHVKQQKVKYLWVRGKELGSPCGFPAGTEISKQGSSVPVIRLQYACAVLERDDEGTRRVEAPVGSLVMLGVDGWEAAQVDAIYRNGRKTGRTRIVLFTEESGLQISDEVTAG